MDCNLLEKAMAEERWYYLHESRQVGPFSGSELHALLAKGIISINTSVWSRNTVGWRTLRELSDQPIVHSPESRLKWAVLALAIAVLGIAVIASELISTLGDGQESSAGSGGPSTNASLMLDAAGTTTPSQVASSTRAALSGETLRELEFWRSIVDSNDVDLYGVYLSRYPAGAFADIAAAKIKELGVDTNAAPVDQDDSAASPVSSNSSKPVDRKRAVKTVQNTSTRTTKGRCWSGNIQECRERCRSGELRACQILSTRSR
jgi:hypothetical protein